ncbi:hypothetical protein Tco_0078982 [Tanacetum coccineum]
MGICLCRMNVGEKEGERFCEPHTLPANVNDIEHEIVVANVSTSEPKIMPANVNGSEPEIVASIAQEWLSMNYYFDPFKYNMTASLNEHPKDIVNEQPSFNSSERDRDENYEPVETLVEDEFLIRILLGLLIITDI